jgi:hypothetical protein
MAIGYARVSTQDQNLDFQVDALEKTEAEQIFQEKFIGTLRATPVVAVPPYAATGGYSCCLEAGLAGSFAERPR